MSGPASADYAGQGTFTVTSAAAGQFTYRFAPGDIATPGSYLVQFTATFGDGPVHCDPVPLTVVAPL